MKSKFLVILMLISGIAIGQTNFKLQIPKPCSNCFVISDSLNVSSCKPYLSPTGKYTWTTTGIYHDTVNTEPGSCDSLFYVNLKIIHIDTSLVIKNDTLIGSANADSYQWIDCDSGGIISGATQSKYVPKQSGTYAVILSRDGCSDTSSCRNITLTGGKMLNTTMVKVFPNPTGDYINIQLTNRSHWARIQIFTLDGREQYREEFHAVRARVPMPEVSGVYLLKITNGNGAFISRKIFRH